MTEAIKHCPTSYDGIEKLCEIVAFENDTVNGQDERKIVIQQIYHCAIHQIFAVLECVHDGVPNLCSSTIHSFWEEISSPWFGFLS